MRRNEDLGRWPKQFQTRRRAMRRSGWLDCYCWQLCGLGRGEQGPELGDTRRAEGSSSLTQAWPGPGFSVACATAASSRARSLPPPALPWLADEPLRHRLCRPMLAFDICSINKKANLPSLLTWRPLLCALNSDKRYRGTIHCKSTNGEVLPEVAAWGRPPLCMTLNGPLC